MNVQLLLLLALAGPFCSFTHASPTERPTELDMGTTVLDVTREPTEATDLIVVSGPSATEPATAPEVSTGVATEAPSPAVTISAEGGETEAPADAATTAAEPLTTDPPAVETAAPTEPTAAPNEVEESTHTVDIESEPEEGLTSGQVVGIVIGALLALAIAIAVVIAVVRRMGKYSSAKNKKPGKKESVMVSPLRKKSAKQQERPKFWKF